MNTNDKMIVFSEDFIEKVKRLGKRILQREQRNSQKKDVSIVRKASL